MTTRTKLLDRAKDAMRESRALDFKREFGIASAKAWCEPIKDIVAFSNSGGGIIIFGVENDGSNSNSNPTSLLTHDTADVTNRISKYTNFQFSEFEITEIERGGKPCGPFAR